MGAASSKLEATNWETATGEGLLSTESSCISGSTTLPTSENMVVTFSKTKSVSQRDYTIKDKDTGNILYKTFEIVGTTKWFDLYLPNSDNDDKEGEGIKVCRVQTDETHKYWDICRYGSNQFDGQEKEEGDAPLFKSCRVSLGNATFFDGSNSSNMHVNFYKSDHKDKTGVLGDNYMKVRIHPILFDTHLNNFHFQIEKVKGQEEQYQTLLYSKKNDLVSYWNFDESTDDTDEHPDVATLHIAKSSDLALHIIMVVITHMIDVERSVKGDI